MPEMPLVSILIPCYNHENFLGDNLESILAQDYKNLELLICDDCSQDHSFEIIKSYETKLRERFNRVVILHHEVNQGLTKSLNHMLLHAKGIYIKIIASDDAMVSYAISTMVNYLEENPECLVVVSAGNIITENQHYPDFDSLTPVYSTSPNLREEGLLERLAKRNEIFAPGTMIRKTVYEEYGLYDETIPIEDLEYWMRLASFGKARFDFLDKPLVYYRTNSNSMSSSVDNLGLEKRRRVFFQAVTQILEKYKSYFDTSFFEEVLRERILSERSFAIKKGLFGWDANLCQQWRNLYCSRELKWRETFYFQLRYVKMNLRRIYYIIKLSHFSTNSLNNKKMWENRRK